MKKVRCFGLDLADLYFRLANIELSPESPEYEGGTWHVEGQLNEHICATALYYYDNENIMPSQLAFRQQSSADDVGEMVRSLSLLGFILLHPPMGWGRYFEDFIVLCLPGRDTLTQKTTRTTPKESTSGYQRSTAARTAKQRSKKWAR